MLLPPTFIAGLLPEVFKPEFMEDKNSDQKVSFPLCSYSIVVDILEIFNSLKLLLHACSMQDGESCYVHIHCKNFGMISLQKWVHFTTSVNHSSGVKHQKSEFTPKMSALHPISQSLQWSEVPKE